MAQSKVETLLSSITLGGDWLEVTLQDETSSYYLMCIKEDDSANDNIIPNKNITQIVFDVGIDTGKVDDNDEVLPLTIKRIVVNYDMSKNYPYENEMNHLTAYIKLDDMPYTFYLKPISVSTKTQSDISTGECMIIVNILGID